MSGPPSDPARRCFLAAICKGLVALAVAAVAGVSVLVAFPAGDRKRRAVFLDAGPVADLPERGVSERVLAAERNGQPIRSKLFLVRTGSELYALSAACTHLGCLVAWNRSLDAFLCPCHRGRYDLHGKVLAGPPPAPLQRMPIKIQDERITIGIEV